ncbi:ribonuclease E activity regulator RraA [Undibacterium sp.]|jgi:regulator of ribonuclease activity A|uniref:ribonuclease E activity regulator RraA n=1 Tax=Undibacterium sp. TaxID=1914977 RepID=UPI002D13DD3D|nr:ribonuclease E activity regulator RraA [Undibacterium sp.]HTD07216.1 ribonuclease E activity regulator RraA [Undibacterium sp.]
MSFFTCDICDANEDKLATGELRVLPPIFMQFGRQGKFRGPVTTLKVFEENSLVRSKLESPGNGHVLVIDGGGSLRCALVGGNLASLAQQNGWAGIVVNGCVRDVEELNACNIGIRALASFPVRSAKRATGEQDVRISIGGVSIHPGDWIYADADGVLVASANLLK